MSEKRTRSEERPHNLPIHSRWNLPEPYDLEVVRKLSVETGLEVEAASVLLKRSHGDTGRALEMMAYAEAPEVDSISLPGMRQAADRVLLARDRGERVAVYSDFDADGVTSAAILKEACEALGLTPVVLIPSRMNEGYGFHVDRVTSMADEGVSLIITADCGIVAYQACEKALELGLDVIVTDHHLPGDRPLPALSVIDPYLESWDSLDYRFLSGAGVAYLLATAFLGEAARREIRLQTEMPPNWAHDLLTLSIAGDGQPLLGLNRMWVRSGLSSLDRGERVGLKVLLEVAGLGSSGDGLRRLSFDRDVTFGLVPRLNAAGRLADAMLALNLLCEKDPQAARGMAEELDRLNAQRRLVENAILDDCQGEVSEEDYGVCAHGPSWHEGVIGIACSRLREAYFRPVALMAGDGELAKGSARGIPGFHVYKALARCKDLLLEFGGHEGAAGFSIRRDRIDAFCERFKTVCEEMLAEATVEKALALDGMVDLPRICDATLRSMLSLEPFDHQTPPPVLVSPDCRIEQVQLMGKSGGHLRIQLSKYGENRRFIWFGKGDLARSVALMGDCDAAFVPYRSVYLEREELVPLVKDIRPAWSQSGLQYMRLVESIPKDRPVILYTWSEDAARSLFTALAKAGRPAAMHGPWARGALGHEARRALRTCDGVVVSTSPWTLEPGRGDPAVILVHVPLTDEGMERITGLSRSHDAYLWPAWQEDGELWLTWTYPDKEHMENLWNYTKELLSGTRLLLVEMGKAWRGYLEASGLRGDVNLHRDGARTLVGSMIRVVQEIGLAVPQESSKIPELRVSVTRTKSSLSDSPWYVKGTGVREGARAVLEKFPFDNFRLWRGAL